MLSYSAFFLAVVKSMKKLLPEPASLDRGMSYPVNSRQFIECAWSFHSFAFLQDLESISTGLQWNKALKKQRKGLSGGQCMLNGRQKSTTL